MAPGSEGKTEGEEKKKESSEFDVKLEMLRQLAEMSTFTLDVGNDRALGRVFDKLVVREESFTVFYITVLDRHERGSAHG